MNDDIVEDPSPEIAAYKSPDFAIQEVEQYLAAINTDGLGQQEAEALQRDFLKRCETNIALRLAYLEHPDSGVNRNDPAVKKLCWMLRYELVHPKDTGTS